MGGLDGIARIAGRVAEGRPAQRGGDRSSRGRLAIRPGAEIVDRERAGGLRLGHALDLDQAHAAVAGDRQPLMIAKARDLYARLLAGLDQRDPILDLYGLAIDDQLLGHCCFSILRARLVVTPSRSAWP